MLVTNGAHAYPVALGAHLRQLKEQMLEFDPYDRGVAPA